MSIWQISFRTSVSTLMPLEPVIEKQDGSWGFETAGLTRLEETRAHPLLGQSDVQRIYDFFSSFIWQNSQGFSALEGRHILNWIVFHGTTRETDTSATGSLVLATNRANLSLNPEGRMFTTRFHISDIGSWRYWNEGTIPLGPDWWQRKPACQLSNPMMRTAEIAGKYFSSQEMIGFNSWLLERP